MGKINILHLSDIHIGNFVYPNVADLAIKICQDLEDNQTEVDAIIVTGDVFDGKSGDGDQVINDAIIFFNELLQRLKRKVAKDIDKENFIFIPGNHDVKRTESDDIFNKYRKFLVGFYGDELIYDDFYDKTDLFVIKTFKNKKIVVIGLNSCKIEKEEISSKEQEWIENINLEGLKIRNEKRNEIIQLVKEAQIRYVKSNWDDYGYISVDQMDRAFEKLKKKVNNLKEYTVITAFHHHFYLFPEIFSKFGDKSLIRNYTDVVKNLQRNNVSIVLHGHKHTPIVRPVVDNKFFDAPESVIYVFSAGSTGNKNVYNRSFQVVEVFEPNEKKRAKVFRFEYNLEDLRNIEEIDIPPSRKYEKKDYIELLDLLEGENAELFSKYNKTVYGRDDISQMMGIDNIIKYISILITTFDDVKNELKRDIKIVLFILLCIHYRTVVLDKQRNRRNTTHESILGKVYELLKELTHEDEFQRKSKELLDSKNSRELITNYEELIKDIPFEYKKLSAFLAATVFFTDLYLALSKFADFYYEKEGLQHKVNVRLEKNTFHMDIPVTSIKLESDVDRRTATIEIKCTNPTAHKVAVLLVKEFEIWMNKFEDSFKEIGLKVYYLRPKVLRDNYEMDNYNFEAYIPKLLPLLTGDNLYKQKEVFVRELIQNSFDAISLRKKLEKNNKNFNEAIEIRFGIEDANEVESRGGKEPSRYIKIIDEGVGMDIFKVERYFTSIGRSFYISDEYNELLKEHDVSYKPISNFGIGFLSAFMVCKRIKVTTKSYLGTGRGLEIDIPNYDGCFFIKSIDRDLNVGTTITLYEDERKLLDYDKILSYIKSVIRDIKLDLKIVNEITKEEEVLPAYRLKKELAKDIESRPLCFIPFTEEGVNNISWRECVLNKEFIENYPCGIIAHFFENTVQEVKWDEMNSGIALTAQSKVFLKTNHLSFYVNYPSSYLQLDVAREKIYDFKVIFKLNENKGRILEYLKAQVIECIKYIKQKDSDIAIARLDQIFEFFLINNMNEEALKGISDELYVLKVYMDDGCLKLEVSTKKEIGEKYNGSCLCFENDLLAIFREVESKNLIAYNISLYLRSTLENTKYKLSNKKKKILYPILNENTREIANLTEYIMSYLQKSNTKDGSINRVTLLRRIDEIFRYYPERMIKISEKGLELSKVIEYLILSSSKYLSEEVGLSSEHNLLGTAHLASILYTICKTVFSSVSIAEAKSCIISISFNINDMTLLYEDRDHEKRPE